MRRISRIGLLVPAFMMVSAVSSADRLGQPGQEGDNPPENTLQVATGQPPAMVINSREVEGIVGKEVRSIANENMGRIVEVIVDRWGRVRAAVIDFGGFLGVGSRRVAVDWNLLQFNTAGDQQGRVTLKLTQDQVRAAPEYKAGKPVVVVGALDEPPSWQQTGSATPEW